MKDILKTVAVLSIIALIAGALLGFVNHITYVSPEEMLKPKLAQAYAGADSFKDITKDVDTKFPNNATFSNGSIEGVYVPVKGGNMVENTVLYMANGKGSYDVDLLILVENNKITNIVVVRSGGTPGIGDKAYKPSYIGQFMNVDITTIDSFTVSKKPSGVGEVEAVAGSTKSSTAVANAINCAVICHKANAQKG